jgi:HSP20 family protein
MSDPWWRRRKKKSPWFSDIYDELEKLEDMIDETMQKSFGNSEDMPGRRDHFRGFTIKIGPDGTPRIREFNDRHSSQDETEDDDQEPLVDFIEEGKTLIILAALPGVNKDEIELRVTESCLTVSVDADSMEWYDEFMLPAKVKPKSANASYKNGVLEVRLEKLEKIVKNK